MTPAQLRLLHAMAQLLMVVYPTDDLAALEQMKQAFIASYAEMVGRLNEGGEERRDGA